jgi:hypothetical protein
LLLPFEALGCTYVVRGYKVGKKIRVHVVSDDGLTFPGVRVILVSGKQVAKSARTNSQGIAEFENVAVDNYDLRIDQLGELGVDTARVTVVDGVSSTDIKLRWPSLHIVRATEIKGTLLDAGTAIPLANTSVTLVNAIDGSLSTADMTQKTGEFDLGIPAVGFYFLKLKDLRHPNSELGPIPVLAVEGPKRELNLAVQETSCGMQYSELCTARAETVSHLAGKLADTFGAAINRAQIELLRPHDKRVLATIVSDKLGHFDFQNMPDDEYQLRVSAIGFAPLLIPITLASQSTTEGLIDVQLNLIGSSCGGGSSTASNMGSAVK